MVFLVIEGFSGSGKTSLAKMLERRGWVRIAESAHAVTPNVRLADRGDTYSDYALVGQVMTFLPAIREMRNTSSIVAEGYLLSDLAYCKIREALGVSEAFSALFGLVRILIQDPNLVPDLYVLLKANPQEISTRQERKRERDRNESAYAYEKYYEFVEEFHTALKQPQYVFVDSGMAREDTLTKVLDILRERGLA